MEGGGVYTACPHGHIANPTGATSWESVLRAQTYALWPTGPLSRTRSQLMGVGPALSLPAPVTLKDAYPVGSHPHSRSNWEEEPCILLQVNR